MISALAFQKRNNICSILNKIYELGGKESVNKSDSRGWTPLMYCLHSQQGEHCLEVIDQLLGAGCNKTINNLTHSSWCSALTFGLTYQIGPYCVDIIKRLLAAGADASIPSKSQLNTLGYCLEYQVGEYCLELSELLIQSDCNVNQCTNTGISPLMKCLRYQQGSFCLPIFNILLSAGAKIDQPDFEGHLPIIYCLEYQTGKRVLEMLPKLVSPDILQTINENSILDVAFSSFLRKCPDNLCKRVVMLLISLGIKFEPKESLAACLEKHFAKKR